MLERDDPQRRRVPPRTVRGVVEFRRTNDLGAPLWPVAFGIDPEQPAPGRNLAPKRWRYSTASCVLPTPAPPAIATVGKAVVPEDPVRLVRALWMRQSSSARPTNPWCSGFRMPRRGANGMLDGICSADGRRVTWSHSRLNRSRPTVLSIRSSSVGRFFASWGRTAAAIPRVS